MSAAQASRIARILREERERAGLSQEELGRLAFGSGPLISRYEKGEIIPPSDRLQRLAEVLRSERLMREAARRTGPAFVGPVLDGAVDMHRSNVAAKWAEEAEEAREALRGVMPILVRPPERWSPEERKRVGQLLDQLIDIERATEYLISALCDAAGLNIIRVYEEHDRKLQARGYVRRTWEPPAMEKAA